MPPRPDASRPTPADAPHPAYLLNHDEEEWKRERAERKYLKPVAWLLGRQVIASFKGTLLFTAYGSKLDARDWMRAEEFPFATTEEAAKFLDGDGGARSADARAKPPADIQREIEEAATRWWRQQAEDAAGKGPPPRDGEFWFDYISDTGDGVKATYSIAYLCNSDLWAKKSLADLQQQPFGRVRDGAEVGFVAHPDAPAGDNAKYPNGDEYPNADLNRAPGAAGAGATELPRGQFLLVGGDATYHLSDYESLHTRFQLPFKWAYADARRDGRLLKTGRRPLFGIPGNHDYYDQLDGFRRQFHHPVREDERLADGAEEKLDSPQLMLPGFYRRQTASYVSLRLPFGWLFWGLDTEVGKLDERQRRFFRSVKVRENRGADDKTAVDGKELDGPKPDRLIVATSAPTTVFGKYADRDDEKSAKAFYQLGLPRPFLDPADLTAKDRENRLGADQCRLDISGDIHQYARYWGRESGYDRRGHKARDRRGRRTHPEAKENYASVVSGLGGAFHHPTTTYAGEICEQVVYPPVGESRRAIAARIFNPLRILRGGGVGVIGFLLAFLVYFAATLAPSSRDRVNSLRWLNALGVTPAATPTPAPTPDRTTAAARSAAGQSAASQPAANQPAANQPDERPFYKAGLWLVAASLVTLGVSVGAFFAIFRKYRLHEEMGVEEAMPAEGRRGKGRADASARGALRNWAAWLAGLPAVAAGNFGETRRQSPLWYEKLRWQFNLYAWPLLLASAAALVAAFLMLRPHRAYVTRFGNSLLVLAAFIWAGTAVFLAVRYSDWLTKMASKITIRYRDWWLVWLIALAAAFAVVFGLGVFGQRNSAAGVVTDSLLTLVVVALLVGLTVLGGVKFGAVKRGRGRVPFALLGCAAGLFHALLQIFVPFLLVRRGSWAAWAWAAGLLVLMQLVGWLLMRTPAYRLLLPVWLVFGAAVLALPYAVAWEPGLTLPELAAAVGQTDGAAYRLVGADLGGASDAFPWGKVVVCVVAGAVGVVSSCVWLGWYFATALTWEGHNNEAAGAAQIERFKQFVRFRLTRDDLTGFVIAVDDPKEDGSRLRPRLVDVVYLTAER